MRREEAVKAFVNQRQKKVGTLESDNLHNYRSGGSYRLLLHGNVIARWEGDTVHATLADWPTVTTRKWVNAACNMLYRQAKDDVTLFGYTNMGGMCSPRRLVRWCSFYQENYRQYFKRVIWKPREATEAEKKTQGVGFILEKINDSITSVDNAEWMRIL